MIIVCISASNIKHAEQNSTSLRTCNLIKEMVNTKTAKDKDIDVEIISLVDYELKPCIGCGACFKQESCIYDSAFNQIYDKLTKANALFIVSAHYAPIPSKLSMLLEKIEQLAFLKRFNDGDYRSPLFGKPVGIIGHGGGTEEIIKYYKGPVLDSIWNALSYPVEMNVIGLNNEYKNGVIIPVKSVKKVENSIFPIQEYDWTDIEYRLTPLVNNVLKKVSND